MVPRKGLPTFLANMSKNIHLDCTLQQRLYHRPVPPSRQKPYVSMVASHPPMTILSCNGRKRKTAPTRSPRGQVKVSVQSVASSPHGGAQRACEPSAERILVGCGPPGQDLQIERQSNARARDTRHHAVLSPPQRQHVIPVDHGPVPVAALAGAAGADLAGGSDPKPVFPQDFE